MSSLGLAPFVCSSDSNLTISPALFIPINSNLVLSTLLTLTSTIPFSFSSGTNSLKVFVSVIFLSKFIIASLEFSIYCSFSALSSFTFICFLLFWLYQI